MSSTVTSDGDFVAFGDEEGSGGSGGLDVARLWEELVAKDSSKIIDASHIPNIDVSKVTGLTASKALVSNASGKVAVSAVTSTELGFLDGVTSNVQTQLNNRVTLSTTQTITGLKYFARDAASVLYVENTASTSTSDYAAVVFRKAGSNIGILAANAENNFDLNRNELSVKAALVSPGPIIKRFRAKARGSAGRIRKRTSHLEVILTDMN